MLAPAVVSSHTGLGSLVNAVCQSPNSNIETIRAAISRDVL